MKSLFRKVMRRIGEAESCQGSLITYKIMNYRDGSSIKITINLSKTILFRLELFKSNGIEKTKL